MALRSQMLAVPGLALVLVLSVRAADEPSLPKGAKLRLGGQNVMSGRAFTLLPPDFKVAVSADGRGANLKRFDLATGRAIDRSQAASGNGTVGAVGELVVSGDGQRFVLGHTGILTVREVAAGHEVGTIQPPQGIGTVYMPIGSVALSVDGNLLAQNTQKGGKSTITIWDVRKGEVRAEVALGQNRPARVVFSPDGAMLITHGYRPTFGPRGEPGGDHRAAQIWKTDSGEEIVKLTVTGGAVINAPVQAAAFSPNGKLVALSCGDGPVDLWEIPAGKRRATLLGRTRMGQRLAFSPDGKTIAAIGGDGAIQRWNVEDGKPLGTTEPPAEMPYCFPTGLGFAADGRVVAWGTLGRASLAWEAPAGKLITPLPVHTMGIRSIAFTANGKEVLTSGFDGKLARWDATTGKFLREIQLKTGRYGPSPSSGLALDLSPDGTRALSTMHPPAFYNLTTGSELFVVPGGGMVSAQVSYTHSTDLRTALVTTTARDPKAPGKCVAWDLVNQKKIAEVELPDVKFATSAAVQSYYGLATAALSPSGERLVIASFTPAPPGESGPVLIVTGWDLKSGKMLSQLRDTEAGGGPLQLAVASERTAIIATSRGRVRLYDYESGKGSDEVESAGNHIGVGTCPIVFSPDRKRFAITFVDGSIYGARIYDWPSAKPVHTVLGHPEMVSAMAFSPDGQTLATGSNDSTVLLWDLSAIGK